MAILKEDEFESFLGTRLARFSSILIHGDDEAMVSSLAKQVIKKLSDGNGSSLLVDQLEASTCKKAPGVFQDAVNSISLLGDRRVIVLDGVDDTCLAFLRETLALKPGGNFVLLKASVLKRESDLRSAFESAPHALAMALYPDDEKIAIARARDFLHRHDLMWGEDAEQVFFALVGFERPIVNQELAKLCLYCLGNERIYADDVEAICGDLAEESLENLIDCLLAGDAVSFDRALAADARSDSKTLLPTIASHLSRLAVMMSAREGGQGLEQIIRSSKPPIFFKRRAAFASQLSRLCLDDVVRLQTMIQSLVLKSRQLGEISDVATSRGLLVLARNLKSKAQ